MREYDNQKVEDLIESSLENIKGLMETNTIVGEPIFLGEVSIIPISKVSVGFVAGGGEYSDKSSRRVSNHFPMAGASGGGISVIPIGFLINNAGDIKFVDVENKTTYQTMLNMMNKIINAIPNKNNKDSSNEESNNDN